MAPISDPVTCIPMPPTSQGIETCQRFVPRFFHKFLCPRLLRGLKLVKQPRIGVQPFLCPRLLRGLKPPLRTPTSPFPFLCPRLLRGLKPRNIVGQKVWIIPMPPTSQGIETLIAGVDRVDQVFLCPRLLRGLKLFCFWHKSTLCFIPMPPTSQGIETTFQSI